MTCRQLISVALPAILIAFLSCWPVLAQGPETSNPESSSSLASGPLPPVPTLPPKIDQVFRMQLALAKMGFSPGTIDGVMGPKTVSALRGFQLNQRLTVTGHCDDATQARLRYDVAPFRYYIVEPTDVARLRTLGQTWLSKSQQDRLDYESVLELVAELSQSSPYFVQRLNQRTNWADIRPGTTLVLPSATNPSFSNKAAFVSIDLSERILQAWDDRTNLLAQFPCSIGQEVFQRPVGALQVEVIIPDPNYTFNPLVFPESEEGRRLGRKLVLPPGPNNPVGVAWIGLNRPGFGIHGTPKPEQVGRAESHGCFRLTNWNAELLSRLVWVSMPVYISEGAARERTANN